MSDQPTPIRGPDSISEAVQAIHAELGTVRHLSGARGHDLLTDLRQAAGIDEPTMAGFLRAGGAVFDDLIPDGDQGAYRLGLNVGLLACLLAVKTESESR